MFRIRALRALGTVAASAILTAPSSAIALNATLEVTQYAHTAWRVADGFTKGAIHSITQTRDGYLWLGTEFGLLRFDGVRTTPWPSDRALPSNQIRSLLTGRDGTLWIGTSKGLASWKDGKLTTFAELAGQIVDRMLEDREGTVWVRVPTPPTGSLCAIRNNSVRCWGKDGGFGARVTTLFEDRQGRLWFGEPNGVWQWGQAQPTFHPTGRDERVEGLSDDGTGALLVVLSDGIYRMVDGTLSKSYQLPSGIARLTPLHILRDRDGGVWIASLGGGLTHLHGGAVDEFSRPDGLSSDSIDGLFEDREGNIWVATHAGLDRFRELGVTPYTARQGFTSLRVLAVTAAPDGSVWVRTADGLSKWNDGRVTAYREFPEVSRERVRSSAKPHTAAEPAGDSSPTDQSGGSLFLDERGRVWLSGTSFLGYVDRGRFTAISDVVSGRVHAIAGDFKGNLWLAHETQGLVHLARDHVVEQTAWKRLGHEDYADAVAVEPANGDVWLGFFRGGVQLVRDGRIRMSYSVKDGLGQGRVNDLRLDHGVLWAATEGGVSRLKDGRFTTLSARNGLPCAEAHWTIEDDAGDFWVSMPCGLVRISRADLDAWTGAAEGQVAAPRALPVTVFESSDGVRSRANVGPYSPHIAKARDGRLWFFPLEGLNAVDPRRVPRNTLPPIVHVEQIDADGHVFLPTAEVRLPPLVRNVGIDYTALSFVAPEKMRFRIKLEGRDRDWQDVGSRRQAFYIGMAPGSYRFRVMASNNDGLWNGSSAFADVSVAPAYYQTRWFLALCVIGVIFAVWVIYQLRVRRLARELSARFDERMAERTRVARDLHDTLLQTLQGSKMVADAALSQPNDPDGMRRAMEQVSVWLGQSRAEGRAAVNALRSVRREPNQLEQALRRAFESCERRDSMAASVSVDGAPRALRPIVEEEIYRIAYEAIRNACRHSGGRRLEISVNYSADFALRVADDGIGIDPAVADAGRDGHFGLQGMRERAARISATLTIVSSFDSGTEIRLVVPGPVVFRERDSRFVDRLRAFVAN
jgi:signal transduction histidine kinase/ligand-binding sensor domain-containing protein